MYLSIQFISKISGYYSNGLPIYIYKKRWNNIQNFENSIRTFTFTLSFNFAHQLTRPYHDHACGPHRSLLMQWTSTVQTCMCGFIWCYRRLLIPSFSPASFSSCSLNSDRSCTFFYLDCSCLLFFNRYTPLTHPTSILPWYF